MRSWSWVLLSWLLLLAPCLAPHATVLAQETAASPPAAVAPAPTAAPRPLDIPRPDQLEPGVNTTTAGAAALPAPAGGARAVKSAPATTSAAAAPRQDGSRARKGPDRLELETTDITGNRELPKVLYIVPWKRSDLGDIAGRPVNSLLDEVLQPLDRDVFKRENRYYDALKPERAVPKADLSAGSAEKP